MTINDFLNLKLSGNVFYIFVFILGSCIGSFLNVVIYRLPIMLKNAAHNEAIDFLSSVIENNNNPEAQDNSGANCSIDLTKTPIITDKFNLSYPQSHCPRCKNNIPAWANIPIIGFFITKMRCHYCHLPISWRYPVIEALTAALFMAASIIMPNIVTLILAFIYISIFICLTLISYDKNPIPKSLAIFLLWLGLLANTLHLYTINLSTAVIGVFLGGILGLSIELTHSWSSQNFKLSFQRTHASGRLESISQHIIRTLYLNTLNNLNMVILSAIIGAWFGYIRVFETLSIVLLIYILTPKMVKLKFAEFYLALLMCIIGLIVIFF